MTATKNAGLSFVASLMQPDHEPGGRVDRGIQFKGVVEHGGACGHDLGCAIGAHTVLDLEIRANVWAATVPPELACAFRSSFGRTQYCAATEVASPAAAGALGIYS